MEIQIGCEYVPAEITDLLKGIVGAKVMKLTRFSWWKGSRLRSNCRLKQMHG
ncbi:hypothetical protein ATH33_1776 [Thermoactinomyces vulgaris]|jgi:hypothetical protein|nr:hypothetical protein ATH33_1776 [Thermoactinomyces vulgaris]